MRRGRLPPRLPCLKSKCTTKPQNIGFPQHMPVSKWVTRSHLLHFPWSYGAVLPCLAQTHTHTHLHRREYEGLILVNIYISTTLDHNRKSEEF